MRVRSACERNRFTRVSEPPDANSHIAAIVLAAGASRRLGRPKQLVEHGGCSLLGRAIGAALEAGAAPVVVVLGASADAIKGALPKFAGRLHFVHNPRWEDGMGTSIACGVNTLTGIEPTIQAALVLACDQPALDSEILKRFVTIAARHPGKILLADYGTGRGPPALFPRTFFDELAALRGDSGARDVHRRHPDLVQTLPFPGGGLDIDTPEDLNRVDP